MVPYVTKVTVNPAASFFLCGMKTTAIHSFTELLSATEKNEKAFLLLYRSGSQLSECAIRTLNALNGDMGATLYTADVNIVRDIHDKLHVNTVPTLVVFNRGQVVNVVKGCQTGSTYRSILSGRELGGKKNEEGRKIPRIVVYTTPTCSWCTTLKSYLDGKQVPYREVDVASDTAQAEAMVRKSGQQGVPQTEINGQMIVGFNKPMIDRMLGFE